jgi:hypothetical protein
MKLSYSLSSTKALLYLLAGAGSNYVEKATEAIKRTMLGNPAKQAIGTVELLNANNAILSKLTTDLVATARSHKGSKKGKRVVNQARFLSKADADRLREEQEAKERAEIAHICAMEEKRHQQALKKLQMETEKAEGLKSVLSQKTRAKSTRRWPEWPVFTGFVCLMPNQANLRFLSRKSSSTTYIWTIDGKGCVEPENAKQILLLLGFPCKPCSA